MKNNNENKSIWRQLEQLTPNEIMGLVEAAVYVLKSGLKESDSFNEKASLPLINTINQALLLNGMEVKNSHINKIISESDSSLNLCKEILTEISCIPVLANEVESTYNQRNKMMGIEPVSWLLAGALLALALKVKEIDIKKGKVQFYNLSDKALEAFFKLLSIKKGS